MMKRYFIVSGLCLDDNNRGTAALGYGTFPFLEEKGILKDAQELLDIQYVRYPWQLGQVSSFVTIQGKKWKKTTIRILTIHRRLLRKYNIVIPYLMLDRLIRQIAFVAAINGGDGFSDIYNTSTFMMRLPDTLFAMRAKIPLVLLPQTIGPFENKTNKDLAERILRYASKIYVRDEKFINTLQQMGIQYELTRDLSAYMQPEPWDIDILPESVGINISGLCYSNTFRSLSGQFEEYKDLIDSLIRHFQAKGKHIYLIPHSYSYSSPENSNDDMVACREAYEKLYDKTNVTFVDKNLSSPQVKYVISKMSFFVGTRMHANFAAIYTGVPVFGLAYSYKFSGAFNANGLDAEKQTYMINNITHSQISDIIKKIDTIYTYYVH